MTLVLKELQELEKELVKAKGPDWKLDKLIFTTLKSPGEFDGMFYTASLDACIALCEEVLPGCGWTKTATGILRIWPSNDINGGGNLLAEAHKDDLCITFLLAIVRALIAQGNDDA